VPEAFEVYPNRDSLPFMADYGFDPGWPVETFVRGTLRLDGWAAAWADIFARVETLDAAGLAALSDRLWAENAYDPGEPDRVVLCVRAARRPGRRAGLAQDPCDGCLGRRTRQRDGAAGLAPAGACRADDP
jgi:hypothetical protein